MILSARRKFLKSDATRRSCLKSFWKRSLGKVFQAMVSVMAVKIQLSSPSMVRLSPNCPGILSSMSTVTLGARRPWPCMTNHRSAILIGVVRHDVKRSAGRSGFMGRICVAEQAASWMQLRCRIGGGRSAEETPWR